MKESLPQIEWLDQEAEKKPEQEYAELESSIANSREDRKKHEAEMREVAAAAKLRTDAFEVEGKQQSEHAAQMAVEDEETYAPSSAEIDDTEIMQQLTIEQNLEIQTVTGTGPGRYYDSNPYHGWWRVHTHNEGGVTTGNASVSLAARRMRPYAHARGDGTGISDDNDVTTWTKLFFAFWPRQNGHVRAYVPYFTRGWYRVRANDGFFTSKEACVDLDVNVRLHQNYWGGNVKDNVFRLSDDNINRSGRIDLNRTLYSGSLPVGANKWVICEVEVRTRVETEGSGSIATLSFRGSDYIFVPWVRFDFS